MRSCFSIIGAALLLIVTVTVHAQPNGAIREGIKTKIEDLKEQQNTGALPESFTEIQGKVQNALKELQGKLIFASVRIESYPVSEQQERALKLLTAAETFLGERLGTIESMQEEGNLGAKLHGGASQQQLQAQAQEAVTYIQQNQAQITSSVQGASSQAYEATVDALRAYFAAAGVAALSGMKQGTITSQELKDAQQKIKDGNAYLSSSQKAFAASNNWTDPVQVENALRDLGKAGEKAYELQSILAIPVPVELEEIQFPS